METTMGYRDNGKENGNYGSIEIQHAGMAHTGLEGLHIVSLRAVGSNPFCSCFAG